MRRIITNYSQVNVYIHTDKKKKKKRKSERKVIVQLSSCYVTTYIHTHSTSTMTFRARSAANGNDRGVNLTIIAIAITRKLQGSRQIPLLSSCARGERFEGAIFPTRRPPPRMPSLCAVRLFPLVPSLARQWCIAIGG